MASQVEFYIRKPGAIRIDELFDGRLERHGIRELVGPYRYPVVDGERFLRSDGVVLAVGVHDDWGTHPLRWEAECVDYIFVVSGDWDEISAIMGAISREFGVKFHAHISCGGGDSQYEPDPSETWCAPPEASPPPEDWCGPDHYAAPDHDHQRALFDEDDPDQTPDDMIGEVKTPEPTVDELWWEMDEQSDKCR
jgi:hypothetical protein